MLISPALLLSVPVVFAASSKVEEAERVRLSEEMRNLVKKNQWIGVDQKYRRLIKLKKARSVFRDHYLGAQAAFNLGNVGAANSRLSKALEIPETEKTSDREKRSREEAKEWSENITSNFFDVEISVHRKFKGDKVLKIAEQPFMPEEQDAIAYAKKVLEKKGEFKGMLPRGDYSIGDKVFKLAPEKPKVIVEVVPPKQPPLIKITGVSPRLDLGLSLSQAGEADASLGINSESFGGAGTRLGVGAALGLGKNLSMLAELGYHNIISGGSDPSSELQTAFGYEATPTRYHAFYAWLAAGYQINKISAQLGPTFNFGSATVQGLDVKTISNTVSEDAAHFTPMTGSIRSAGVSAGVTYDLMDIGKQFKGGVSTLFGVQSDSARWYSWGQFALTITSRRKE